MSRRNRAGQRSILPDPLFHSELLAKFINAVMSSGKKSVAERIVYGALDQVVDKLKKSGKLSAAIANDEGDDDGGQGGAKISEPKGNIWGCSAARDIALAAFRAALENITPNVEVKSRRVGGSTYQVPVEIRATRKRALAMRWLVEFSQKRNEKTMVLRLANEIVDALDNRGGSIRKREDVHRMAKANQAFAHYRW